MKKYLILEQDAGTIAFHYEVLHPLYSVCPTKLKSHKVIFLKFGLINVSKLIDIFFEKKEMIKVKVVS